MVNPINNKESAQKICNQEVISPKETLFIENTTVSPASGIAKKCLSALAAATYAGTVGVVISAVRSLFTAPIEICSHMRHESMHYYSRHCQKSYNRIPPIFKMNFNFLKKINTLDETKKAQIVDKVIDKTASKLQEKISFNNFDDIKNIIKIKTQDLIKTTLDQLKEPITEDIIDQISTQITSDLLGQITAKAKFHSADASFNLKEQLEAHYKPHEKLTMPSSTEKQALQRFKAAQSIKYTLLAGIKYSLKGLVCLPCAYIALTALGISLSFQQAYKALNK